MKFGTRNLKLGTSARRATAIVWLGLVLALLPGPGDAAVVYEADSEFLTSSDFNGDGIPDALVLDKLTGNARVGYQSPSGTLIWSVPLPSGVENATGCGVENFLLTGRDAIAVTAPDLNRVHLVNVSKTNVSSAPVQVTLSGIGPHSVIGLTSPLAPPSGGAPFLLSATAKNDAPPEQLDLLQYVGAPLYYSLSPEVGSFERGNALSVNTNAPTFAVGVVRGATNDELHVWQFTNSTSIIGLISNLPSGSDYAFGRFNSETLPRFWLYVPGGTNISIRSLQTDGASFTFGAETTLAVTQAIERIYIVGLSNDSSAMIQFSDGLQGARLPAGTPVLGPKYASGGGASGNTTGVVPLGDGKFVFLGAPTGAVSSLTARVMSFDGTNYTVVSSNSLPALTTRNSRANIWLFQSEPFVNSQPNFVASINAPDWSGALSGLPGSLSARVETDAGSASGLGTATTNNLGAQPAAATYGLPDQYRDDISFFSYGAPKTVESIDVFISPAPGLYDGAVTISLNKQSVSHVAYYRLGASDTWHTYSAPFVLDHNATVEYYARTGSGTSRSPLHFATYQVGNTGEAPRDALTVTNAIGTNLPPTVNTNITTISANGTVFYGRRSPLGTLNGMLPPSAYLSFADSPFNNTNGMTYFYLENLEDNAFNTPGATPSAGWIVVGAGAFTDSVDGDDGVINGSGAGGHSYYSGGTQTNLTVTFNAAALGGKLPTHVGIVWTDVGVVTSGITGFGNVIFTARDANGNLIGSQTGSNLGDGVGNATTSEDRFFGVVNPGGISSITITMPNSKDWEVDHLQYGRLESASFGGSIWAINLDGSGEDYITTGLRPRVSRDGHYLSFLRENDPATNQFGLWVRDLANGAEFRLHSSSTRYVGHDWTADNQGIIFDNNCNFWRIGFTGAATQLPLTTDCRAAAPSVNPLDGRLAFQVIYPGGIGLYLAPSNAVSRQDLNLSVLSPRWPAWSPDGTRIAIANDPSITTAIDAGDDLFVVKLGAQTNVYQITALTGNSAFRNGAVWTPGRNKLVSAGRINGTNGLWVIPLATDGSACHCPPILLPTTPGDDIDFAGGVVASSVSVSYANLGLFIRSEPSAIVVYWSTNYDGFTLQSAAEMPAALSWTPVNGPYFRNGPWFEYHESRAALAMRKHFRLAYPGVLVLTPSQPQLDFHLEPNAAILNWPLNYVGYTLEAATNLTPPVIWQPLDGPYPNTNGAFKFRRTLPGPPQEFYRLRGP